MTEPKWPSSLSTSLLKRLRVKRSVIDSSTLIVDLRDLGELKSELGLRTMRFSWRTGEQRPMLEVTEEQ